MRDWISHEMRFLGLQCRQPAIIELGMWPSKSFNASLSRNGSFCSKCDVICNLVPKNTGVWSNQVKREDEVFVGIYLEQSQNHAIIWSYIFIIIHIYMILMTDRSSSKTMSQNHWRPSPKGRFSRGCSLHQEARCLIGMSPDIVSFWSFRYSCEHLSIQ